MKIFTRIIIGVIVLWGLFWVTWHGLSLDKRLHTIIHTRLEQQIHRDIEWESIHLGFFALSVDSLRLSEVPDFSKGTFVQASRITIHISPRSLWRRRVTLVLEAPTMEWGSLKTRLDGTELLVDSHFSAEDNAGTLSVKQVTNPAYQATDFRVEWALEHIDPTLKNLDGTIKLHQGHGRLVDLQQWAASSPGAKIALMPILALQRVENLGFIKTGLPDLSKIDIEAIDGDYSIQKGMMMIKAFTVNSRQLQIKAGGRVDLPTEQLAVEVSAHSPEETMLGQMDIQLTISGPLSSPKVDLKNLKKKLFKATINQLLSNPSAAKKNIDDALKNIFK